jgi:hypothetical protein
MTKTLYIMPSYGETTRRRPYQKLREVARKKGYDVIFKNIDWKTPLSKQFFSIEKGDTTFSFSLGAILGRLVAQENKCEHLILASMTQLRAFKDREMKKALTDLLGKPFVEDIVKHLKPKHKAQKQTILYGALEDEPADILVPKTEHELTPKYLSALKKLL